PGKKGVLPLPQLAVSVSPMKTTRFSPGLGAGTSVSSLPQTFRPPQSISFLRAAFSSVLSVSTFWDGACAYANVPSSRRAATVFITSIVCPGGVVRYAKCLKILTVGRTFDSIGRMKRRRFMQALAAAPAVPALAQQVRPAPPSGGRSSRGALGVEQGVKEFELTQPDAVADPAARFFTPAQFGALKKLSDALMPPMSGNPGAIECEAPEFLDFLIGVSPVEQQQLYRGGLDALNAKAKAKFSKSFAELDPKQVDAVLRPLLAATPWAWDLPKDPV